MSKSKTNMYQFNRETKNYTLSSETLINARNQALNKIFMNFEGDHHKLEHVKTIRGIDFIDDAQSHNSNAVWYALESMYKPTTWIMNMSQIEMITEHLLDTIDRKVEKIVIQGVYNSEIVDFFTGLGKKVIFAMNLEDAVRSAFYACEKGEVILFSPGSPVDGVYSSFDERGNKFKSAVSQL